MSSEKREFENAGGKYSYVSFSKINFNYDVERLIESAASWEAMESETLPLFDYLKFKEDLSESNPVPASLREIDHGKTTEERLLAMLANDRYRSGDHSFVEESKELFLQKIRAAIERQVPVDIILPSFPGREVNPIARTRPQIHLGELAAMCRLAEICELSKAVYEKGIRFIIVGDGVAYAPFYGDPVAGAVQYRECLKDSIKKLGVADCIRVEDLADIINERKPEFDRVFADVEKEVSAAWEDSNYKFKDDLAFTMRMGTQSGAVNAAAVHLVKFMDGSDDDARILANLRSAVSKASTRTAFVYHCLLVTLRRMELLDRKFPDAIRGTVHAKTGQYAPHLVNEFTAVSPWHGVAVRRRDGRVDVAYEANILSEPTRYIACFLPGEVLPFYYQER